MTFKKSLLGLALAGAIALGGAGVGTYAYFTSDVSSGENKITAGTLGITKDTTSTSWNIQDAYPGQTDLSGFTFKILNEKSLPVKLNYTVKDTSQFPNKGTAKNINSKVLTFEATVSSNNTSVKQETRVVNMDTLDDFINEKVKSVEFKKDDTITVVIDKVDFSKDAGNEYQGAVFNMNITVDAYQTNDPTNPNK